MAPGLRLRGTAGLSRSALGSGLAQLRLWDIFPASGLLSHAQPRCRDDGSLHVEMGFLHNPGLLHPPVLSRAPQSTRG